MALCSVADVRAVIYTKTLTDADITAIISSVSDDVLGMAESTDETNTYLIIAGKNAAYAATLRRMKSTGELAASIKFGNSQQNNSPDSDIKAYEAKSIEFIEKYKDSIRIANFSLPCGRVGYGTVNAELDQ
jgi:hypothetical protein